MCAKSDFIEVIADTYDFEMTQGPRVIVDKSFL